MVSSVLLVLAVWVGASIVISPLLGTGLRIINEADDSPYEAAANGQSHRLYPIGNPQFLVNVREMSLDGLLADEELLGDQAGRATVRQ